MSRIAVIQRPPVLLDRERTLQAAVAAVVEAAQGGALAMRAADIPETFPGRSRLYPDPDEWINPGDSVVIAPWGKIEAGPLSKNTGILYAEIDTARCGTARHSLDVAGHYARPDVFEPHINRRPRQPVAFD